MPIGTRERVAETDTDRLRLFGPKPIGGGFLGGAATTLGTRPTGCAKRRRRSSSKFANGGGGVSVADMTCDEPEANTS